MTQQRPDLDPRAWGETKHQIGDSNIRSFGLDIHYQVFMILHVAIAAFVLIALANQDAIANFFGWLIWLSCHATPVCVAAAS